MAPPENRERLGFIIGPSLLPVKKIIYFSISFLKYISFQYFNVEIVLAEAGRDLDSRTSANRWKPFAFSWAL